jgi:GT2 family glycosyltransferase
MTLEETVDVAFITINYNTKALVEKLIDFLLQARLPYSYSITVVDNNSSDGSLDAISSHPQVHIIRNDRNLGYGTAANLGVRATKSRYVCVLNTDVILNAEALTALWNFMEGNEKAGMCTPVVRYGDGRVQLFFFKFSLLFCYWEFLAKFWTKLLKLRLACSRRPMKIDGITGALLFLRRSYIDNDALFDEDFFFYFEDTDLARRWKRRGYASYALPCHSIIHLGGQSGKGRNNSLYYSGKYLFLRKHYGERHTQRIRNIDVWRIARKVHSYRLLSLVCPTKHTMRKLSSYRDYQRGITSEHRPEEE